MNPLIWILLSPVLFILPGLYPARLITGRLFYPATLLWSVFFSVVLLPPLGFGLAILLKTTVKPQLVLPVALVLGVFGLIFPRTKPKSDPDARDGDL